MGYTDGWEMLLLAAGTDPKAFGDLTNRYTSWVLQYFEALAETAYGSGRCPVAPLPI